MTATDMVTVEEVVEKGKREYKSDADTNSPAM